MHFNEYAEHVKAKANAQDIHNITGYLGNIKNTLKKPDRYSWALKEAKGYVQRIGELTGVWVAWEDLTIEAK